MNSQLKAPISINDHLNTSRKLKLESIIQMNNEAIECIGCCDEEAELCFRECLEHACVDVTSHVPQQSSTTEVDSNLGEHGEYDEGMSTFSEPIFIFSGLDFSAAIATILYNQGLLCLRQDRYTEAINYFYSASHELPASNYCSVNDNNGCVNMLQIFHSVGLAQYRSARYEDALAAYTQAFQVLTQCENIINDPCCMQDVALTLNCLGVIYSHLKGTNAKAIEVYNQSLGIRRDIIGRNQDDKDIACTMNNLGLVYFQNGDYDKALGLYSEALSMRIRLFGKEHLDVAATSLNAGRAYHRLGNLTQALEHYEGFIAVATDILGEFHSDVANGLKGIARIRLEQKEFDEAIKLYQQVLSVERDGEEMAFISSKIADIFCEKGDLDGAIKACKENFELQKEVYGFFSLNVVHTLKRMSHVHKLRGEHNCCVRLSKTALDIECKLLGKFHPDVSSTLSSIALVYYETRNYKEALKVYQDVLRIQRQVFGHNHAHPAGTLRSIGTLLLYTKHYEMAARAFDESLKIYRALDKPDDIASVLSNIASIQLHLGDYEKCIMHYSEALSTLQRALGCVRHIRLIPILKRLGNICRQRGMLHESILYLTEAMEILNINARVDSESGDSLAIAEILNEIGKVHLQRGETDQMMLSFTEASRHLSILGKPDNDFPVSNLNFYDIYKLHPECASAA